MHWLVLYRAYSIPPILPYLQPAAMMHAQLVNMALGVDHDTNHIHSQHIECVKSVRFIVGLACRVVQRERAPGRRV